MSYTYSTWGFEGCTVVREDEDGCKLAVRERDYDAAEIMEACGDDVFHHVDIHTAEELRGVIEALEAIEEQLDA